MCVGVHGSYCEVIKENGEMQRCPYYGNNNDPYKEGCMGILHSDTLNFLQTIREEHEKELDDNPNWRAANSDKYGVRR